MKKITIISILLNVVFIVFGIVGYNKFKDQDMKIVTNQKESKVFQKELKVESEIDKEDPIYIYKSRKFPCDKDAGSSIGYGLCSMERLQFVDSLLNGIVKFRLKEFDDFIKRNKEGVLKAKGNSYFVNCLKINIASKENFVRSQKVWEEMRVLNSEEIHLGCDGGSACGGLTNDGEIKYVLERIEKIKKGGPCF